MMPPKKKNFAAHPIYRKLDLKTVYGDALGDDFQETLLELGGIAKVNRTCLSALLRNSL